MLQNKGGFLPVLKIFEFFEENSWVKIKKAMTKTDIQNASKRVGEGEIPASYGFNPITSEPKTRTVIK